MSRTYRNNPRAGRQQRYSYDIFYEVDGWLCYDWRDGSLSRGGWKEAKRVLPARDYARLRVLRGDKLTHDILFGSVPHWYRHELEKELRHHTSQELHRYKKHADYEPMFFEKLKGVRTYFLY